MPIAQREDLNSACRTQVKKSGVAAVHTWNPGAGDAGKTVPDGHQATTLAYAGSSKLMRDSVSKRMASEE